MVADHGEPASLAAGAAMGTADSGTSCLGSGFVQGRQPPVALRPVLHARAFVLVQSRGPLPAGHRAGQRIAEGPAQTRLSAGLAGLAQRGHRRLPARAAEGNHRRTGRATATDRPRSAACRRATHADAGRRHAVEGPAGAGPGGTAGSADGKTQGEILAPHPVRSPARRADPHRRDRGGQPRRGGRAGRAGRAL